MLYLFREQINIFEFNKTNLMPVIDTGSMKNLNIQLNLLNHKSDVNPDIYYNGNSSGGCGFIHRSINPNYKLISLFLNKCI